VQPSLNLSHAPNVVVEWLTHLLRIREVPGSNFGPETGYPDWGFSRFFSISPENSTLKLVHDCFLPRHFQFIITYRPFIWRYIVLVAERASLNNYKLKQRKPRSADLKRTPILRTKGRVQHPEVRMEVWHKVCTVAWEVFIIVALH
jgi:hypothetical protein